MDLSENLLKIKEQYIFSINGVVNFLEESYENIAYRIKEAKDYREEFRSAVDYLKNHMDEMIEESTRRELHQETLKKISIVVKMYNFANLQSENVFKMALVFLIALLESFNKSIFY